jgi:UDP-glucose 4-epimerase
MKALVCGGAGYIGSHMVRALIREGHDVLVVDDLSTGHRAATGETELAVVNLLDESALDRVFASWKPDVVFHFAAFSVVRDSVADPLVYYRNNIAGSINLLSSMRRHGVSKLVFSSTAAVYGMPSVDRIDESQPLQPINPYGSSKVAAERLLCEAHHAYGIRSVSFRYFNAAGADPSGGIGEAHDPETHLIPNVLRAAAGGTAIQVYGSDYATPDGTCIRDYVHVCDLARAHLRAAQYLDDHDGAYSFNLGSGNGCSVLEVISAAERVTGRRVDVVFSPRREGDPDRLVASHVLASKELSWLPTMSDIDNLVGSAWAWHLQRNY